MTREKKKTLVVLSAGISAMVLLWSAWSFCLIMNPDPGGKEFGMLMLLALPLAAGTLVGISAAIEDIKRLMKKDEEAEKTEE